MNKIATYKIPSKGVPFKVVTDIHLKYPFPSLNDLPFGPNVIYLGDIIEAVNFRSEHTKKLKAFTLAFFNKCIETGTHIVRGNHEGGLYDWLEGYMIRVEETKVIYGENSRILLTHGLQSWKRKRVLKWWAKKIAPDTLFGSKWLKSVFSKTLSKARLVFRKNKHSKKQLKNNYKLLKKYGCYVALEGHTHPSKFISTKYKGRLNLNFQQGITEVNL